MKRFIGILTLITIIVLTGIKAEAQTFKFGHINTDELLKAMPEYDSALVKLQNLQKTLQNQLEIMQVELNNKAAAYTKDSKTLTDIVRQSKEQELQDMQNRIQDFQNSAAQKLQDEQNSLTAPIFAKVDKAIKDVGKEGGFTYVFDVAKGQVLYFDETKSTNVLALVKTKLGLK
jgi:outer membrane protein